MKVLPDLNHEIDSTRKLLERVPEASFSYKPHERSMALGMLAQHTSDLFYLIAQIAKADEFDFASAPHSNLTTSSELMSSFETSSAAAKDAVGNISNEELEKTWTLKNGGQVIFQTSKQQGLRSMLNHIIHHRGQLTVYLRLLNVPVPGLYGPSADEQ